MKKRRTEALRRLPPLGHRIVKTGVAVSLCLVFYWALGYRGAKMPTEAAITAIICMQPYLKDSRDFAFNRMVGTLVGGAWGLLLLLALSFVPRLGEHLLIVYALMGLGVLLSLYTTVLFRMPDASGLAAIVFLCVVVAFPEIQRPLLQSAQQIGGVLVGTGIAIGVNVFRLPRVKQKDKLFFLRTRDLIPDQFAQVSPAALFRLNYLYNDGARICLMSEHAPAFFLSQLAGAKLSVPMIVMDGAALFDANENRYLWAETIRPQDSLRLREYLDRLGLSYFIYTIHRGKVCIFHQGEVSESERVIYQRMRRSPYRSYLEGEILEEAELVYLKLIGPDREMAETLSKMQGFLHSRKLRGVVRPQGAEGISGLYIYSAQASPRNAQIRLLRQLREQEPGLQPVDVFSPAPYENERDAIHLLHRLGNLYEPPKWKLFRLLESKKSEREGL